MALRFWEYRRHGMDLRTGEWTERSTGFNT